MVGAKKIVEEMEKRYDLLSETGTKNIEGYNKLIQKRREVVMENPGKIKLNGKTITNIPEIAIIEVGT